MVFIIFDTFVSGSSPRPSTSNVTTASPTASTEHMIVVTPELSFEETINERVDPLASIDEPSFSFSGWFTHMIPSSRATTTKFP